MYPQSVYETAHRIARTILDALRNEVATIRRHLAPLSDMYGRAFAVHEIAEQPILKWMFGASLLFFYTTFSRWIGSNTLTVETAENGNAVCWPYFQNCTDFYFLQTLPDSHSQMIFYMALYTLMTIVVWAMWRSRWRLAHAILALLLLWEIIVVFLLSYLSAAPYHYYHIVLTSTLLFAYHKEFFLKVAFVFMYFMSSTIKLDDGWVLGSYFTSLKTGLPLIPDAFAAPLTNVVIFSQIVGSWFLLSRTWILQRGALVFFALFHLYSGVFVGYFYPTVALPTLLILFGPMYRFSTIPFTPRVWRGWLIIVLLLLFQVLGFAISMDRRLTLEGNRLGMFMFEANHQCAATITTYSNQTDVRESSWEASPGTKCNGFYCTVKYSVTKSATGSVAEERMESGTAWNRCDPYEWWSRLNNRCDRNPAITRISLTFDHSINGDPFYRIVDEPDICDKEYQFLRHNEWIKTPPEAPAVGLPVTNTYHY